MNTRVAIITLNWNSSEDTICCLDSMRGLNLNNTQIEIYVVDNASEREDYLELKKYIANMGKDLKITLIRNEENLGFGLGNNTAIDYIHRSNYDFVWFVNNDTIIHRDALRFMIETILRDKNIGLVGSTLIYEDNRDRIQTIGGGEFNSWLGVAKSIKKFGEIKKIDYITAASCLIRMKVLEEVHGFNEEIFLYWEDVDLSLRARQKGWKISVATKSILYHKESSSTKKLGSQRQKHFTKGLDIVLRNHTRHSELSIVILHTIRALAKMLSGKREESKIIINHITRSKYIK